MRRGVARYIRRSSARRATPCAYNYGAMSSSSLDIITNGDKYARNGLYMLSGYHGRHMCCAASRMSSWLFAASKTTCNALGFCTSC
eukprot:scaffold25871_cov19-Prasinocladus_malaysianus.AAC.1